VTIVTVAADRRSKTEALSHAVHAPFSMLSDPDLKVINAWGVREDGKRIAAPCMFLVARGGLVRWRYLGKNMTDRPDLDKVLQIIDRLTPPPR
jgi:peroxiredoxin